MVLRPCQVRLVARVLEVKFEPAALREALKQEVRTVSEDIRPTLKRYAKIFRQAAKDKLSEADTVLRLTRFFEEVLGYDPFEDITREQAIKGTYVDIALKVDGQVKVLVEAKAAGTSLREGHTQQAQNYAANQGIPWVLLTNGVQFVLYRIDLDGAIEATEVFRVDLAEGSVDAAAERLAMLHRKAMKRGTDLERYYLRQRTLSPEKILKALASESVLTALRRELRSLTGTLVSVEDVFEALKGVLKDDTLVASLKIRRTLRPVKGKGTEAAAAGEV